MWDRLILIAAIVMLVVPAAAAQVQKEPPSAPYKKVSTLVKLPDFLRASARSMSTPTHCQQARFSPTTTRADSSAPST
jgi:hypothetical protein